MSSEQSNVASLATREGTDAEVWTESFAGCGPVRAWGLPLAPLTRTQAADAIMERIDRGVPTYFITANLHYAMLSHRDLRLQQINEAAALILADGAPVVWASRWRKTPVPERVAGSDLIFDLCERAALRNHGIFLLGGPEGVADLAAERLQARFPGLRVVGTACPPNRPLTADEHAALIHRIRDTQPALLLVAYGQPKGEYWISENLDALGVPVAAQVGATLEFVAGRVRRAPRWVQKISMEWAYRMWLEPRRLGPRYYRNALFLGRMAWSDLVVTRFRKRREVGHP